MPKTKAYVDTDDDASTSPDEAPKKRTKIEKPSKQVKVAKDDDEENKKKDDASGDEAVGEKENKAEKKNGGDNDQEEEENEEKSTTKKSTNKKETTTKAKSNSKKAKSGEEEMHEIGHNRFISVSEFKGQRLINIREYYEKDDKLLPGKKGISLKVDEWKKLKSFIQAIDDEL